MTLVYPATEDQVVNDRARLHALVIGVANYPHLLGGNGAPASDALNLGQVTTPQPTALAIVDWLRNSFRNPNKPLGSIELLLSPSAQPLAGAAVPPGVETATYANIRSAFKRWLQRCSSHRDNIAFLYFCGHGLAREDQFILPEDFRDPAEPDPWANCINFDTTRVGMRACQAQTQIFFVDACRETPFGMLVEEPQGQRLIASKVGDSVQCTATYYATTEGKQAFGPPDGVTYFGQAVIQSLNGLASWRSNGAWVVSTSSLAKSLVEVMSHYADRYQQPLACNPNVSNQGLLHEPNSAAVLACIRCSSPAATAAADIQMRRSGKVLTSAIGDLKPMVCTVEPGEWEFVVTFPTQAFPPVQPMKDTLMPGVYYGVPLP